MLLFVLSSNFLSISQLLLFVNNFFIFLLNFLKFVAAVFSGELYNIKPSNKCQHISQLLLFVNNFFIFLLNFLKFVAAVFSGELYNIKPSNKCQQLFSTFFKKYIRVILLCFSHQLTPNPEGSSSLPPAPSVTNILNSNHTTHLSISYFQFFLP